MSGVSQLRPTAADAMVRADAAHAKLDAHEDLCAQRYGTISDILVEVKSDLKDQRKLMWGVILSVAGTAILALLGILLKSGHLT